MRQIPYLVTFLLFLAPITAGRATSVIPPSFPELVAEADGIYRGTVTDIQTRRATAPDGTAVIKTYVTFGIARTLKGTTQRELTLEFLGGTLGDETMWISGMPQFNLGATEYVFVQRNGRQFCPLVALGHGRYRVARDHATAREHVVRDNGLPLTDLAEVETQLHDALPAPLRAARVASALSRALTPAAFEAGIATELQRPVPGTRRN